MELVLKGSKQNAGQHMIVTNTADTRNVHESNCWKAMSRSVASNYKKDKKKFTSCACEYFEVKCGCRQWNGVWNEAKRMNEQWKASSDNWEKVEFALKKDHSCPTTIQPTKDSQHPKAVEQLNEFWNVKRRNRASSTDLDRIWMERTSLKVSWFVCVRVCVGWA